MISFVGKRLFLLLGVAVVAIVMVDWAWQMWNEDKTNLTISEIIELDGTRFMLNLPDYGVAQERRATEAGIEFIFFPEFRTPRSLSIQPADLSISLHLDQTARGPDGLVLDYGIDVGAGGSGGAEFVLFGILRTPKGTFDVFCSIQGELITEKAARWCIPALHSLTAIN